MTWVALLRAFGRIGLMSFGGPAAQIALMHKVLVDERGWLTEQQFLNALSFCMLLPGPEAMQLATYAGWRLKGVPGGLLAGALFVIPGAVVMAALASVYALYGAVPFVQAIFLGIKAVVIVIVLQALLRISKKALGSRAHRVLAGLSFLAIFALHLPFPLIIALAALWGWLATPKSDAPAPAPTETPHLLRTTLIWGALWALPVALLWITGAAFLTDVALFFSKLAVVTFGGAYAVLAYMTQEVVVSQGWITTEQMIDGLGLAETTPGPLILVTEFVGFLAGYREAGLPLAFAAAVVTLWVTFIPCFLWIFAGAPYIERLTHMPRLAGALHAITAAVVGVILNLSLWFAVHVFFGKVGETNIGPLRLLTVDPATFDPLAAALALAAALIMFQARQSLERTLIFGALAGALIGLLG